MESLGPEYKEDRVVIWRVEGIDQIKKELSRDNPSPTLLGKETKELVQLTHCITTPTEALLRIINQPIVFRESLQAYIYDLQK